MRANRAGKRKNALGGPHKSLIWLDSDKQIQAFPLVGFGRALLDLAQFGSIWLNLAQFGSIWLNLAQFGSIWLNLDSAWDFPWMLYVTYRRHGPHPELATGGPGRLEARGRWVFEEDLSAKRGEHTDKVAPERV
jgi:hypothetical protein